VRRLGALIVLALLLVPAAPVRAQEDGAVRLRLVRQSSFATEEDPLKVRVAVENDTDAVLTDLTLRVSVYPPANSRSAYALSLETDVTFPESLPDPGGSVEGSVEPASTRVLPPASVRVGALADFYGNGLFPVKVELLAAGAVVGFLRSSVVFIEEEPKVPLNVSLTFVLDAPVRTLPDGTFMDGALSEEIAEDGPIESVLRVMEERPFKVTLVLGPLLLDQLGDMSDGFRVEQGDVVRVVDPEAPPARRAASLLERIASVATLPDTEVVALPYASPSVPSLAIPELGEDLRAQLSRGRRVVAESIGVAASETILRPPGGALSEPAISALDEVGVETLLLDADSVEQRLGSNLTPPPIGTLVAGSGQTMTGIIPDLTVDDRLDDFPDDPVLRAQRVLGELSAIYFERPSDDRGVSLMIDHPSTSGPRFLSTLAAALTQVPDNAIWLRPAKASRLLTTIGPEEPGPLRRELDPSPGAKFSDAFLTEMALTQVALQEYATVAGEQVALLERLRGLRFIAESRWLLRDEDLAFDYLQAARSAVQREFAKIDPPAPTTVRLTSRNGPIPLTIHSRADYPMRVALVLQSPRLEFLGGARREVTLSQAAQQVIFQVRAQTTGRFPVEVLLETPDGGPITASSIVVRSTAYNRVALIVTIGAALFLAAWWGRRFLPRRR
jgi:Family of unknown function (DUF6049)